MCHSNTSAYNRTTMHHNSGPPPPGPSSQHQSVAGHSSIPGSCSSDHKPESVAAAAASTEVEDFAQLAEQLQLDQISKDGNGTETFQMIEEEDLVAILKDVAAGGSSGAEDFNLSANGQGGGPVVSNPGGVPVSLAGSQMADLINTTLPPPATSNSSNPVQQLPLQTQMASAPRTPQMQQTPLPNISQPAQISSGCETVIVSTNSGAAHPAAAPSAPQPISVKTVTLCQPPLPPPPAMASLEASSFIPTKPSVIPFSSSTDPTPTAATSKSNLKTVTTVNRALAPAPPKALTAYVRLPVTASSAATANMAAAVTKQRQKQLNSIKKRKSRKSRQQLLAPAPPPAAVAPIAAGTILQHVLPVQAAAASQQFAPTAGGKVGASGNSAADFDTLYLNSTTSNVSPDSGIQSEGVANSPLHLTAADSVHQPQAVTTAAVTASTLSPPTLYATQQHQQTISMQQLTAAGASGPATTVLTQTQTRQIGPNTAAAAAANWAAAAAAAAPISPQFPGGTAFIVQQSSTTQQSQAAFVQNQTNQTTYVYTNGAPFLVTGTTQHTTTSQNHLVQPAPQQQSPVGVGPRSKKNRSKLTTPPPTLLPAMPTAIFQASNASSSPGGAKFGAKDSSSSSSAGSGPESASASNAIQIISGTTSSTLNTTSSGGKRGRGRPKGSKNRTKTTTTTTTKTILTKTINQVSGGGGGVAQRGSSSQQVTMVTSGSQTEERSLVAGGQKAKKKSLVPLQVINYTSSSQGSGDEADEDSDSGFSLPPSLASTSGQATSSLVRSAAGSGRPASKDCHHPPKLTPEVSAMVKPKRHVMMEIPAVGVTANETVPPVTASCEVNMLDSDDSIVFSDGNEESSSGEEEEDLPLDPPNESQKRNSPINKASSLESPPKLTHSKEHDSKPSELSSIKSIPVSPSKNILPRNKSPSKPSQYSPKSVSPKVISPSAKLLSPSKVSPTSAKTLKVNATLSPGKDKIASVSPRRIEPQSDPPAKTSHRTSPVPPPLRPEVTPTKAEGSRPESPPPPVLKAALTPAKPSTLDDLPPTLPRMRTPSPPSITEKAGEDLPVGEAVSPPPLSVAGGSPGGGTCKLSLRVSKHKKKKKSEKKKKKRSRHASSSPARCSSGGGADSHRRSSSRQDRHQHISKDEKRDIVFKGADGAIVSLAYSERSDFTFKGAGESVFSGKYSTLKKNELLWEKPEETDVVPLAAGTDKHSCAQKTGSASNSSSAGRILTKGFIKEIFTGVSGGAGAGASTRTMMAVLEEASKRPPVKSGRKKGKKANSSSKGCVDEWSDTASRSGGGSVKGKDSPGSSCHSSNKSPFSPRSSVGSDHPGIEEVNNPVIKYGGILLDCSQGYKTKDRSHKKAMKAAAKRENGRGAWKSKHKNVVDPVFLCDIDSVTQELSACQIEISQVSANYWPERPHDSVPSIFRKRKIKLSNAEEAFEKLLQPHLPMAVETAETSDTEVKHVPPSTPSSTKSSAKKATSKRGRPKSVVKSEHKTDKSTSGPEAAKTSAEQRLPLKKRHRHHLPAKSGSIDDINSDAGKSPAGGGTGSRRVSKEGRQSRKSSVELSETKSAGPAKPAPQRRLSAADRIAEKLNIKVKPSKAQPKESAEVSAMQTVAKPPCLEKVRSQGTAKRELKSRSPPRLSPQRDESPQRPSSKQDQVEKPETPTLCHQPKYSDISDDDMITIPVKIPADKPDPKPPAYYTSNIPSAQSLTSASAEEAFDKLLQSDTKSSKCGNPEIVTEPTKTITPKSSLETSKQGLKEGSSKTEEPKMVSAVTKITVKVKPVKKPQNTKLEPDKSSPVEQNSTSFDDLEADIQPLVVKTKPDQNATTQECSVVMSKLQEGLDGIEKGQGTVSKDTLKKAVENAKKELVKKRKRRANKTGFPSIKKKKKTSLTDSDNEPSVSRVARNKSSGGLSKTLKAKVKPGKIRQSSRIISKEDSVEVSLESATKGESLDKCAIENKSDGDKECEAQNETPAPDCDKSKSASSDSTVDTGGIKKPRGRPPKRRADDDVVATSAKENTTSKRAKARESSNESSASSSIVAPSGVVVGAKAASKRSRSLEDESDSTDCLALLPVAGMESVSGPSSEAPSGAETDNNSTVAAPAASNALRKKRKKVSLFKKKSLVAGLFSDFYKSGGEDSSQGNSKSGGKSDPKRMTYVVGEHPHGLLPPPYYCGRQLRAKKEDFQLPYDLWWMAVNKQLPGRDVAATWNYKRVKNNVYFDVKPWANFDAHACQCTVTSYDTSGCGEDCINRMTYTECDSRTCPAGDKCTNNQIQKHKFTHGLERFMTDSKGWGVKTKQPVGAGQFIMEYVGEVVSEGEFKLRMSNEYADDTHHYCMHMDGGIVIDGHRMGGECRFVNHSCQPNCEMQKWCVNGLYRMALFSRKSIEANEELTYDYNFSLFNPHEGQACKCGSVNCRGVIGGRTQRVTPSGESGDRRKKTSASGSLAKGKNASAAADAASQSTAIANQVSRSAAIATLVAPPVKPLSMEQKEFIIAHRCFLFRNFEKIRLLRDKMQKKLNPAEASTSMGGEGSLEDSSGSGGGGGNGGSQPKTAEEMIKIGLDALATGRSMGTRRLAIVQEDPNVTKVVKLAQILREMFAQVTSVNDPEGKPYAKRLQSLPNKKKYPTFFTLFGGSGGPAGSSEVIPDLNYIEKNIKSGSYVVADTFDRDILRMFQNFWRYFGRDSYEGTAARFMRQTYNNIKPEYLAQLTDVLGSEGLREYKMTMTNSSGGEEGGDAEDRIDCFCGQFKDEGLMIQCEKCQVWQHCDCVGQCGDDESYVCARCVPDGRSPNLDIPIVPQPEYASQGEQYYVSMVRQDQMQLRIGDTVYVLRAKSASSAANSPVKVKSSKKSAGKPSQKIDVKSGDTPTEISHNTMPEATGEEKKSDTVMQAQSNDPDSCGTTQISKVSVNSIEGASGSAKCDKSSESAVIVENGELCKTPPPSNRGGDEGFSHGGIPHKMMSPLKGPSLEASSIASNNYPTYKSVDPHEVSIDDMDIFRIERLWTNAAGEKFAFGHHYLRPHETFHEPSRKFFVNEVFRVPIHEVLPLDTIWKQCWVLDVPTFGRGRPLGALEEHVYICEYRVDKTARLFNKISKPKYPTCTKWFAFDLFDQKLKPQRIFTPHVVPPKEETSNHNSGSNASEVCSSKKSKSGTTEKKSSVGGGGGKKKKKTKDDKQKIKSSSSSTTSKNKQKDESGMVAPPAGKTKLEATLLRLLAKLPKKNAVDASYLLKSREKRIRKKSAKASPKKQQKKRKKKHLKKTTSAAASKASTPSEPMITPVSTTEPIQEPAPSATVETKQEPEVPTAPTPQVPAQEEQSPTPPKAAQLLPTAPPPETPKEKPQQPIIRELAF